MDKGKIIVIGAGVLGTFHAYFAARKGYQVLLFERNTLPNDASTRNFGMGLPTIAEVGGEWAGYAFSTLDIYRSLQQESDISARTAGSLYLASTELEAQVLREFVKIAPPEYGGQYFEAKEAQARFAFVQESYCVGALHFPNDLTIEPRQLLRQLIPYLTEKESITYIPNTNIVEVSIEGADCMVRDARGNKWAADQVFICSGAEYRTLFPEHFVASGLIVCKLQMMETVPQARVLPHSILSGLSILRYPAFKICPSYDLLNEQPGDPFLKENGVHLLLKQAADGSVVIGDSHEYKAVQQAAIMEEYTDSHLNEAILQYARQMVKLPTWEIRQFWNGFYLNYPKDDIYTETIADKIHIVTGIGGKGMSTGAGFCKAHIEKMGF